MRRHVFGRKVIREAEALEESLDLGEDREGWLSGIILDCNTVKNVLAKLIGSL